MGISHGLSEAEQVHTFELTGHPDGKLSQRTRPPQQEVDLRAKYQRMNLRDLQTTLDDMEDYLDGRFYQRWAQWLLEGAPMSKRDYRIALEVC